MSNVFSYKISIDWKFMLAKQLQNHKAVTYILSHELGVPLPTPPHAHTHSLKKATTAKQHNDKNDLYLFIYFIPTSKHKNASNAVGLNAEG